MFLFVWDIFMQTQREIKNPQRRVGWLFKMAPLSWSLVAFLYFAQYSCQSFPPAVSFLVSKSWSQKGNWGVRLVWYAVWLIPPYCSDKFSYFFPSVEFNSVYCPAHGSRDSYLYTFRSWCIGSATNVYKWMGAGSVLTPSAYTARWLVMPAVNSKAISINTVGSFLWTWSVDL